MKNPILYMLLSVLWVALGLGQGLGVAASNSSSSGSDHKHLKTSTLLTCMNNSQFSATYFDVRYYPFNESIVFNIDAMTAISGNVTVKVEVIAYGLNIIEKEFDLCSLNEATLCPLSAGRIDVASTYQLKNNDLTNHIPKVVYTIPDLDAQVRVLAYKKDDTSLSKPIACVQAVLSNGKTVQTKYASWPIAAVSGVGLLTSGFVSVIGYTSTAAHIASNSISLFIYFQNLAITAMMGVSKLPPIAAAWTQNFQWSMGIINVKFMQDIFNWYVQATKGTSTVVVENKDILSISVQKRNMDRLVKRVKLASSSDYGFDSIPRDSSLYTTNERNTTDYSSKILVLRGMERVAFRADIELSNFFLTGVVFFLFFVFAMTVAMIFFKALLEVLTRARIMAESSNFFMYRKNWGSIIKGTLFRIAIIAFPQISLLSMWEFTQRDSPAVIVDAVVMMAVVSGLLIYGTLRVLLKGRMSKRLYKNPAYLLFGDANFLNRYGFLYTQFRADRYWWLLPLLCYGFFRSLFVAVLQEHGKAQALILFIIELFYFVCLCWIRPYLDKRTNIFNIFIHLVTLINSLFFLFFSNLFKQPPIVSSVMAIVLFVLNAVFALFLLLFTIITCSMALWQKNPDSRYEPLKDDRVSFIPKIQGPNTSLLDSRFDSDSELFDLRKAAMDTNETEQEKNLREDAVNNKLSSRIIFDDEVSSYSSHSNKNKSVSDLPQAIQPTSAVLGTGASSLAGKGHPRVVFTGTHPNGSANNLLKPESSFYTHGNGSHSNPYL